MNTDRWPFIDEVIHRRLDDPYFGAATDEELAQNIVATMPRWWKWPDYDRRLLVERVTLLRAGRGAPAAAAVVQGSARPSGSGWLAIVRAHRQTGEARPKMLAVARNMGFQTEEPLRRRKKALGIADWRDVHELVATEPE